MFPITHDTSGSIDWLAYSIGFHGGKMPFDIFFEVDNEDNHDFSWATGMA